MLTKLKDEQNVQIMNFFALPVYMPNIMLEAYNLQTFTITYNKFVR